MLALPAALRRVLDLLAGSSSGASEALLMAHGFTADVLDALILAGLASADTERMMAGGRVIDVRRFKITAAGRVALER